MTSAKNRKFSAARLSHRQARVEGLQLSDALPEPLDAVGDPVQYPRPRAGRHARPGPVGERAVRGRHRAVDVSGATSSHLRVGLVGNGVADVERRPVSAH